MYKGKTVHVHHAVRIYVFYYRIEDNPRYIIHTLFFYIVCMHPSAIQFFRYTNHANSTAT